MLYILIRICPRDDYIGRLAYESLKMYYPDATYGFLAERGDYKYITEKVYWREKCDNFGGQHGAKVLLQSMRDTHLNPKDSDVIFLVDSDIVMFTHLGDGIYDVDHGGVYGIGRWGLGHVSGQFQILSGRFFNFLTSMEHLDFCRHIDEMLLKGIDIADDTVFSYISDKHGMRKRHIHGWVHYKFFEYNGRVDYNSVVQEISNRFNTTDFLL